MAYFKIKNITNLLNKRHPRFSTPQNIECKGFFGNEANFVSPGHEIIVESDYLPVSAHQLRVKGFIVVQEISKNDYLKLVKIKDAQILAEEASVKQTETEVIKSDKSEEKRKKKNFENIN